MTSSLSESINRTRLSVIIAVCLIVGIAFTVGADESKTTEELLDNWAEAVGGRALLSRTKTIHATGRMQMAGLDGTFEEWITSTGLYHCNIELAGIFNLTIVRTPEKSWIRDQNGKVSERAGRDAADQTRDVFLATWSHLIPGRMPGGVEYLGMDPETGSHQLRILPRGGTELTVWINPETNLPMHWQSPAQSGDTLTTFLENWHDVEGINIPVKTVQSTGTPESEVITEIEEIHFNESPPSDTFTRPQEKAEDIHFTGDHEARDIPLDIDGVHLFLEVHVNGSDPLWFVLDSGAGMTGIDTEVARDLGLDLSGQVEADGVGEGKITTYFVQDVSFELPGVEISGQTVLAAPLRNILEARIGREIDGILGYDFISRFVVEIDYWNQLLHLHNRHEWEYEGTGTLIPIKLSGNVPACDATIHMPDGRSITCNLEIDTGSGDIVSLSKPFTEKHDLLSTLEKRAETSGGFGIGGVSRDVIGRITGVSLAGLEFTEPVCEFSLDSRGVGADVSIEGKLGGGIFERGTVILDYERQRMFFEPNPRFGSPFPGEMCGLTITTGGRNDWHTFTVTSVIHGSPADNAGIKTGDRIISADGIPASDLWLRDLSSMFREKDRTIQLEFIRDNEIMKATLIMKPIV